jgi:ubiquinol-cytochrome c reductase subunit 9
LDRAFDTGSERIWDNINRGVRAVTHLERYRYRLTHTQRQWKDIKQRYVEAAEDDE